MLKFLLKWLVNGAIVVALLLYYSEASFWGAVLAATGLTVMAYVIGDQLLLRLTNNLFATIADFLLAAVYLYVISDMFNWTLSMGEIVTISLILGLAEWFFHRYVFNEELEVPA
ncbi:DUF2512 family protein [Paenibacillus sp. NPDC057967]|uniref:DUF2512 family protein n=1 Tax=Paenibacillus sp. NPDC057967 TaxID=3346293 RepID=UPI0036D97349